MHLDSRSPNRVLTREAGPLWAEDYRAGCCKRGGRQNGHLSTAVTTTLTGYNYEFVQVGICRSVSSKELSLKDLLYKQLVVFGSFTVISFLSVSSAFGSVEPGYYPPRVQRYSGSMVEELSPDPALESNCVCELDKLMHANCTSLWIEATDRIKIISPRPSGNRVLKEYSREEVAAHLKRVADRTLLRVWISTARMWESPEKRAALVRELEPSLATLGYDRVLIFGLKPHNDGHTLMHPNNGCVKVGIFVFKDTTGAGLLKSHEL